MNASGAPHAEAVGPVRELFLAALSGGGYASPLDLTRACVEELPVDCAAIVVTTAAGPALAAASDPAVAEVEQEQVALGLGPAADVVARSGPVIVPDLAVDVPRRWPALAAAAALGGALLALPLHLGAIRVGVLDLYRRRPGELSTPALGAALDAADLVTTTLLLSSAGYLAAASEAVDGAPWPAHATSGHDDREVHQATGMVSVQLDRSAAEAYVRLRARAFAEGRSVGELARDVVSRRVRFDTEGEGGTTDVNAS